MGEADAEEAPIFLDVQLFAEVNRVVVSIPGEEAAVAELGGKL